MTDRAQSGAPGHVQSPGRGSAFDARSLLFAIAGGVTVLAWVSLWIWERSPYGRYLNHAELAEICFGAGAPSAWTLAGFYVAAWTLMIIAMMLPTTLPLLEAFRRLTAARRDRVRLLALVVAGYLVAWTVFGAFAHLLDMGLHLAFERGAWLRPHAWALAAGPLLLAGAYQFSSLKYRCLEKCRAPLSFVVQHWRGGDPSRQALALGAHHGLFCVGCCWALMMLMFGVGLGSLDWMLVLGALMALEKNVSWGRRIGKPLGFVLIGWGSAIAIAHALPLSPG